MFPLPESQLPESRPRLPPLLPMLQAFPLESNHLLQRATPIQSHPLQSWEACVPKMADTLGSFGREESRIPHGRDSQIPRKCTSLMASYGLRIIRDELQVALNVRQVFQRS